MSTSLRIKSFACCMGFLLLGLSQAGWAEYACPSASDTRGGWIPPSCAQPVACSNCGVIESINLVKDASGLGAAAGAVAGGLLGNQVGKGKGRTLATIAGAVGGGVAGHYGEKYLRKRWDVVVKLDDGTHKTVSFDTEPGYAVGDKVKVVNNTLVSP